jgi:hypothetical protein
LSPITQAGSAISQKKGYPPAEPHAEVVRGERAENRERGKERGERQHKANRIARAEEADRSSSRAP